MSASQSSPTVTAATRAIASASVNRPACLLLAQPSRGRSGGSDQVNQLIPTLPDSHPARWPYMDSPSCDCRVNAFDYPYTFVSDVHLQESTIVGTR
jgi:hypothetical protein